MPRKPKLASPRAGDGTPLSLIGGVLPQAEYGWTSVQTDGEETQIPFLRSAAVWHVDAFAESLCILTGVSEADAREALRSSVKTAHESARAAAAAEILPRLAETDRRRGLHALDEVFEIFGRQDPTLLEALGALSAQAHDQLGEEVSVPLDELRGHLFNAALTIRRVRDIIPKLRNIRGTEPPPYRPIDAYTTYAVSSLSQSFKEWTGRPPSQNPNRSRPGNGRRRPFASAGLSFVRAGLLDLGKDRTEEALWLLLKRLADRSIKTSR